MATSQHVEIEAAKFLQKLIHESKDEPAKLATKLHVICQHMKASGKEHSLPYQVISRAMETVVNQHGLDIEAVKAARLPTTGGPQIGEDSGNASRSMDKDASDIMTPAGGSNMPFRGVPVGGARNAAGSSSKMKEEVYGGSSMQSVGAFRDSKPGLADNEVMNPNKPPVGPSRVGSSGHDFYQGPVSQRSGSLYDHESPSSLDTRSGNSQERVDTVKLDKQGRPKEPKKAATKRKRAGSTSTDVNPDNPRKLDTPSAGAKSRKGKGANKGDTNSQFAGKSGEHAQVNPGQDSGPMEHLSSASSGMDSLLRAKQENQISNVNLSEGDGHGAVGQQKEGFLQGRNDPFGSRNVWDQYKTGLSPDNSQLSRFAPTGAACGLTADTAVAQSAVPFLGSSKEGGAPLGMSAISGGYSKVQVGMPGNFGSYTTMKAGFPASVQLNNTPFNNYEIAFKLLKERGVEPELAAKMLKERGMEPSGSPFLGKGKDMASMDTAIKSSSVEPSSSRGAIDSEHRKSALMNDSESNISEKVLDAQFDQGSGSQGPQSKENIDTGKAPTARPPVPGLPFKEHHLKQLRAQCLVFLAFRNGLMPRKLHLDIALGEPNPREGGGSDGTRDTLSEHKGKEISVKEPSSGSEATGVLGRPTGMSERTLPGASSIGIPKETESTSKDTDNFQKVNTGPPTDSSAATEERSHLLSARRNPETEMNIQEESYSQAPLATTSATVSVMNIGRSLPKINSDRDDIGNGQQQIGRLNHLSSSMLGMNQQLKREMANLTGTRNQNEVSINALSPSTFHQSPIPQRTDYPSNLPQLLGDRERGNNMLRSEPSYVQANLHADRYPSTFTGKEASKTNSGKDVEHSRDVSITRTHWSQGESHVSESQKDSNFDRYRMASTNSTQNYGNPGMVLERAMELGEENKSICTEITMSPPKYTTSEKWIMDHQKRKLCEDRNWAIKQRKTEERMAVCFNKLKEVVSSSDDISTKTKSVIELKKLQLLQLQRRLRSEFANDFFKPTTSDIERLKTFKKHKHGRRVKQLEKYEQKMKEERQKRIRERQKEFFSEIEVHKERLEDWFKIKRERWKGFNKYVKEFHKKKERIHREKIDRIQREKINLLKNNDVEGYLRMVQDAKSDRVKQLLKETEKYLQKLGSKVQESKALARQFEVEMDENRASPVVEKNEVTVEKEDDSDQAEHYLESNQKYYLMAHSIKESIADQPASLQGGQLREYQMNGLRWLVSLYNNNLNGILADEMGLGKTVQVISLICYLMEAKNDRGPFLVVVPSSVLSGWVSELSFWAPSIIKIAYAGPPEERRKLFKERIVQQKFNVLLTTYEYLMNKHDRPKLSRIQWHYVIIDEGHRIKNASCKLNADLKHYKSAHRLLLTGTPLQNNLEELWALLNFLLPSIFNSSDDFSQWFNKPFESGADTSPDDALLSEEENLLIINRLHQVLRPFVLRRLKHKVEHELPEKIERLVRCESSAYQKLLMKRVEDNLGCIGNSKGRSVHNSVMELRNICNHPYISQLHAEQVDSLVPRHYLPPIVRLCGKLEMLDRLLPKLKATDHRVLFFSTMTRLLDVMEEYLRWKNYRYLRLDGHTTGGDRGALIDEFNRPDSPAFIFLLSIRAGGVGVNLQAADTVIIFDTDWNPQVDLQAQARAHRIGQKKDVLVLRMETVHSVEEHVRAAAEHKLGVANQSITAGFFDNHTSAEDRREYLESLLRESKKEESASVLDDDALNDLLARSESEIETFELIDKQRRKEETIAWQKLVQGSEKGDPTTCLPMPSRLVTDEDLKAFVEAMQAYEDANAGLKQKSEYTGGLDAQYYGRGKRAREVRSYEDQMTEEEFEKMCQVDPPDSPEFKDETKATSMGNADATKVLVDVAELLPNPPTLQPQPADTLQPQSPLPVATSSPHSLRPIETPPPDLSVHIVAAPLQPSTTVTQPPPPKETPIPVVTPVPTSAAVLLSPLPIHPASSTVAVTPPSSQPPVQMTVQHPKQQPSRRGRGRPKRAATVAVSAVPSTVNTVDTGSQNASSLSPTAPLGFETPSGYDNVKGVAGTSSPEFGVGAVSVSVTPSPVPSVPTQAKGHGRKTESVTGTPRSRAKKQTDVSPATLLEIISSSATSKERGVASDAIMPAGVSDVPTVTDAVGSPLSRVQTGTPRSSAKKQTAVSPTTLPEIIPSSATSKERGVASDAIMLAGVTDVPTVTDAVGSPLSRVQTAVTMASDNSSPATISQDKQELVSAQSGTSAPTIVTYEVNPVTGLHRLVELVPVRLPITSPIQEKHKTPVPKRKKVERGRTSPVTKPVTSETTMPDRKDKIGSAEFEKDDGVKVSMTHGLQEPKIDQTATPVMSALAQDLMERRNLRTGPKYTKSVKKQKTTAKPGPSAAHIGKDAGAGFSTSVPKPQDVSGGPNSLNLEPLVVKPVPTQENVKPIIGNSTSISELHSTAIETISAQIEISSANPVESGAPQSSMSTADTPSASSLVNQKPAVSVSSRQTRFSAAKEKARAAPAARRGPRKKDLARAAATAVNTSGPTTRGSLVGSLEMESSSKTAETDITKGKVEINSKSKQEPYTKEQLDCAVQSECQSASSTLHINASSSTMDGNSPCVQEAEQIDAQYKLKNDDVQCESSSGVVQAEPALVKALTEGDSSMHVDTNNDVEASITLTGKSIRISKEHHYQAVVPIVENVNKEPMDENRLDSLATDSATAPPENLVASGQLSGEASITLIGKSTRISKEHHYQAVVPIVENVSKEPMDENRLDSLATDSATAPPENLVTSCQLSGEVFSIAEKCSSTLKEPQQSVVLFDVDNVPEEPNSGDQVESVAVDATALIRGDSSEDPMVQKAGDSNNDSLASSHTKVPKCSSLQGVPSKNDILDEDTTSSMDNNHAIHEEGLMNPENTIDIHISRERPDFIDLSLPGKMMRAHDNDQNTKLYKKSEVPGVVTEDNETFVFSVTPAATESCGPGERTPEVRNTTCDVHQSEEPSVISEDKVASVGVGYCDMENPIPRDQAASHDIQSFNQCVRRNQETFSEVSTSATAPESCKPISQAQDPSCHDQIFKESIDVSGDKATHAMGVSTSFIAESCKSEELIHEIRSEIAVPSLVGETDQTTKPCNQKPEEPGVSTEDKENHVLGVTSESSDSVKPIPEIQDTGCDVLQSEELSVMSKDKETAVLKVISSVGVEHSDLGESVARDQDASHHSRTFGQCVTAGNTETVLEASTSATSAPESCNLEAPVHLAQGPSRGDQKFKESCDGSKDPEILAMEVNTSFVAEPCKSEDLIPIDQCEVQAPLSVESGKACVDETKQNTKPYSQKPEEPGVRTEDKETLVFAATSIAVSESCNLGNRIPEVQDTTFDVLQSENPCLISEGMEYCFSEKSIPKDQAASHTSQTFEQCVRTGDKGSVFDASTCATSASASCNLEEPRVAQDPSAHDQKFKEFCDIPVLEINISVTEPCKSEDVIPEDQCEVQVPSSVEIGKASVLTDQNIKPFSHQSEEAGVGTTDKETLEFGRTSAAATDSCDPANIIFAVQDTARDVVQSEEPFVTSEDKENLTPKDHDAEIVLEVSTSATGSPESHNLKESICVAQDPSHRDEKIEESSDRCGDKETHVVQFNTSVAEPCKPEELVPEDLCEVDVSMSVECGKSSVDDIVVKEGRQFVKELSPQQVLADLSEDLKTVATIELCAEKDAPMEDIVASVEADGNEVLERSVDSSSISSAPDPREVLKVAEAMDFANVVEDTSMVDVSESQDVEGGNVESFTTSAYVEGDVSADISHDTSMEDIVASVEADGNKVLERSVDSSSISSAPDPREVLKVTEVMDFRNAVEDTSMVDVSESQVVAGGNVESFTTSAYVEGGVSADISHDTPTSEIHQITNASMDVLESADVYEDALAENVNSSSTSVNVEEVPNASMREVPGVSKAVDDTMENVKDVTNAPMEVVSEGADGNEVSET